MDVTSLAPLTQRWWQLEEGEDLQAVTVPSVGKRALLMTQVLEVLQAGRLINYFPGVSLTGDRNRCLVGVKERPNLSTSREFVSWLNGSHM